MKRRPITHLIILAAVLGACGGDEEKPATVSRPSRQAAKPAEARKPVFPEAEAAAVLRALSDGAIASTAIASQASQSESIISYARVVGADYRAIKQLVDSTITSVGHLPTENAMSTELRTAGDSVASGLSRLPRALNNTFIEEQVKANQRAVQIMDTVLIPSARSPQLKTLFEAIRPTMIAHLQRSLQILNDRKKAAQERGEPWESGLGIAPAAPVDAAATPAEAPYVDPYPIRPPRDTTPPDTIPRNR